MKLSIRGQSFCVHHSLSRFFFNYRNHGCQSRLEEVFVHDVPGDANRYVRHPKGVDTVLINGAVVHDGNGYTDARVGQII